MKELKEMKKMNGEVEDLESKRLAWSAANDNPNASDEDTCCCGACKCSPGCSIFKKYILGRSFKLSIYILDIVTDISVAVADYRNGDVVFSAITLSLVFAPGFLFSIFAFTQVLYNTTGLLACIKAPFWILVFPVLPLWPIVRDLRQISHGVLALFTDNRQHHLDQLNKPSRAYLVKFLEAFTEAAPQILLRLYKITIRRHDMPFYDIEPIEYFQLTLSLVTLSVNIISTYQKSISTAHIISGEMDQHERFRLPSLTQILVFFWWLPFLMARFLSMALFAGALKAWVFLVIGIHVVLVFLFQTVSAGKDRVKRIFIYLFSGFVFIFTYIQFNMRARIQVTLWFPYTIYVILVFIENSVMLLAWYFYQQSTPTIAPPETLEAQKMHRIYLIFFHYGAFGLAILMMILAFCCTPKATEDTKDQEKSKDATLITPQSLPAPST